MITSKPSEYVLPSKTNKQKLDNLLALLHLLGSIMPINIFVLRFLEIYLRRLKNKNIGVVFVPSEINV